jgi:hypothetical protein
MMIEAHSQFRTRTTQALTTRAHASWVALDYGDCDGTKIRPRLRSGCRGMGDTKPGPHSRDESGPIFMTEMKQ